jgi:hypothetical protein
VVWALLGGYIVDLYLFYVQEELHMRSLIVRDVYSFYQQAGVPDVSNLFT